MALELIYADRRDLVNVTQSIAQLAIDKKGLSRGVDQLRFNAGGIAR